MSADGAGGAAGRAIVVGAGFGGIAAALRLRALGWSVRLIDRCERLGGRAQCFERGGFRHDAGPTVLTVPRLFEELFALFGERLSDHVTLVEPSPWYRFVFDDGESLDYGPTQAATEAGISRLSPGDLAGFRAMQAHARAVCEIAFDELAHVPFHAPMTLARRVPALLRLRAQRSVWDMVSHHLRDERLRQAFSVPPLLVGGDPYRTTSIYGMISHLESRDGVWFAMGGTGALVGALGGLMARAGVEVELGATVERVLVERGAARGIRREDGTEEAAEVVVSNVDPARLYGRMLPPRLGLPALRARSGRLSMGLFVLLFGARRRWPEVAHHTIVFGPRHRALLDDIFRGGRLSEDVSLYLHRPTATDPSLAPEGCDGFYALCPVPNLRAGLDWRREAPRLRDRVVARLDATVLPGLARSICDEIVMTPEDFERDYLSEAGAGFSLAPHFTQSAWFRYHNRGEGVRGLYLVGAGTHPGAGVPGVLSSAKVVEALLRRARAAA